MISFKNAKRKWNAAAVAAFTGVLLLNGMQASASETIEVIGAPAAIAGSVYEQAQAYEEANTEYTGFYVGASPSALIVNADMYQPIYADSQCGGTVGSSAGATSVMLLAFEAAVTEDITEAASEEATESAVEEADPEAQNENAEEKAEADAKAAAEKAEAEAKAEAEKAEAEAKAEAETETEAAAEEEAVTAAGVYAVPSYSGNKSYESYKVIRRGKAGVLQTMATTNEDGFRVVNGRYMIAVGTYFGARRGQYLDLTLANGTVIPCVVGDMKAASIFSANGCCSEFIVDTELIRNVVSSGDVSDYRSEWNSPVATVTVYQQYVY